MAQSNGRARLDDGKVRVAIIGVGNCANSLLQGVEYYKDAKPNELVPGLMHVDLGGYHVGDIEFTAAFDIDSKKVGKDLGEVDGVVGRRVDRLAQVAPDLGGIDVEGGRELDVPDVVAAQVDVHQPGYEGLGVG